MIKTKNMILFVLLFIVVGIAVVSTTLSINATSIVASNPDDFKVYFSDVLVNSIQDLSLVKNEQELVFDFSFSNVGSINTISYDVTNASKNYDAALSINCTNGNEYLSVTNTFDTSNLSASSTRTGTLTLKKIKSNASGEIKTYTITCTITATPVGRTSIGSENPPLPASKPYPIGTVITIANEKFNVIRDNGNTITMLAQYNLGTNYRQSTTKNKIMFSNSSGWEYTPGPRDIDIQQYDGPNKTYLNEYVAYLKTETADLNLTGDLISLRELGELGCQILWDYSNNNSVSCSTSTYTEWLINDQQWWTKSAYPGTSLDVWIVSSDSQLHYVNTHDNAYSIRPIITISKDTL